MKEYISRSGGCNGTSDSARLAGEPGETKPMIARPARLAARLLFPAWACGMAVMTASVFGGGLQTQTFVLQPGWNAIYLEVKPTNTAVSAVFDGVPVESVWTFSQRLSAVDFIQNPDEAGWNRDKWLLFVPTNRV
jgi:hypothetical protein